MVTVASMVYLVHALLTMHQNRVDHWTPLGSAPPSMGEVNSGPDYGLPIARQLAVLGLGLVLAAAITATTRRPGLTSRSLLLWVLVAAALVVLFVGPMGLDFGGQESPKRWPVGAYRVAAIGDLVLAVAALALAWLPPGKKKPGRC